LNLKKKKKKKKNFAFTISPMRRELGYSVVYRGATGWMIGVSSPGRSWEFFS
jgi:hypothetical protein